MAGWNPWAAAGRLPGLEIWFADVPEPVAAEALLALARELGLGAGGQR
jgi:hypothetical protein